MAPSATAHNVSKSSSPSEQAAELEAVARADEKHLSEVVRDALDDHIAKRIADKAFRERVRAFIERDREVLECLAKA